MKRKAYILVFDGLADWEAAHALCEINKSEKFAVVAVGFSGDPVTTMGGLRILPDITLNAVNAAEAAIFILPGGDCGSKNRMRTLATFCVSSTLQEFPWRRFVVRHWRSPEPG